MSHAAKDSAVVYADDTQPEQSKNKLPIQESIANDVSISTPANVVHSLPGVAKWYRGGRVAERKWFRPCARQYSKILITDSQGQG